MEIDLEKYAAKMVEEMDMDNLISFATEMIIKNAQTMSQKDLLLDIENSGHTPEEFAK